jgi:hypothetical protein
MQLQPPPPLSRRIKLLAFTIAAIPIVIVIVTTLVLAWQTLGMLSSN